MWQKLVSLMRFDGFQPGLRPNPLQARPVPPATPLVEAPFAPNPGNLRMFCYVPRGLKPRAPLVVVLHGCGQTAAGYDAGTGWSRLADELGFALLAPEQKAVNNPQTCFNWFNPEDISRGQGEAASIAAMIENMVESHKLDAARIFITGLSAGGAMAAAMLALYPALFAGGAIIAGIAFGAAQNVREALDAMRSAPLRLPKDWGDAVRAASGHQGPWPKISLWHGALDTVVNVNNAQASLAQWADLHGLSLTAARQDMVDGAVRLNWGDRLEVYTIPSLGHGAPIDPRDLGSPAPYILDAGISSSRRIAQFWGLVAVASSRPRPVKTPAPEKSALPEIEEALAPQRISAGRLEELIRRALTVLKPKNRP